MNQRTIKNSISCSGVGVHSGVTLSLTLNPAPVDTGIIFKRIDVEDDPFVAARWDKVVDTRFSTKIANESGVSVGTVEHLMAALAAASIDNILVELTGPEVPIMDGSSAPFLALIEAVGTVGQSAPRRLISILRPLEVTGDNGQFVRLLPAQNLSFDVTLDFGKRGGLASQKCALGDISNTFKGEIAYARTYGFYEDAKKLWSAGLSKGASLENTVVFDEGGLMNEEGLRHPQECVRHKVLDALGDLYLAGMPIQGAFVAHNCGHMLNNLLLHKLFQHQEAWEVITPGKVVRPLKQNNLENAAFIPLGNIACAT